MKVRVKLGDMLELMEGKAITVRRSVRGSHILVTGELESSERVVHLRGGEPVTEKMWIVRSDNNSVAEFTTSRIKTLTALSIELK